MINHVRSLLVNRPGSAQNFAQVGEEYIPTEFSGQSLSGWLRAYWSTLFGSDPDTVYLNFQVSRLLRVVHATPYASYVTYFDNRLTYDPRLPTGFENLAYGFTYSRSSGSSAVSLTPVGEALADARLGRMYWNWELKLDSGYATIVDLASGSTVSATALQSGSNVSAPLILPANKTLRVMLQAESDNALDWNGTFNLTAVGRPVDDLSVTLAALSSAGGNERLLFGGLVNEPYRTFAQLWAGRTLPERVTGLVLALAFRLHESYEALITPGAVTVPAIEQPAGDGEIWPTATDQGLQQSQL